MQGLERESFWVDPRKEELRSAKRGRSEDLEEALVAELRNKGCMNVDAENAEAIVVLLLLLLNPKSNWRGLFVDHELVEGVIWVEQSTQEKAETEESERMY